MCRPSARTGCTRTSTPAWPCRACRTRTRRAELRDRALAVLAALPEGQRAAFVLRDLEGLTSDEVGEVLGLDAAAVRQRVHRARLVLRGALMETMEDHER
ncbi:MAG: sigma-70 family RNA polymerase sigma factor [Polyangiaceae bacterium]